MATRVSHLAKGTVLNFIRSPAEIKTTVGAIIAQGKKVQDAVAAQSAPTFQNTIAPLARFENEHGTDWEVVQFLQNASTDKAVRDASSEAEQALSAFKIESMMRADVYRAVRSVFSNPAEVQQLSAEDRTLVEKLEKEFRRNGLALEEGQREKLGEIRKRLSELSIKFGRNISEGDGKALFTREELEGLPDDFFEGRATEVEDGTTKFVVTTKYPDLVPVTTSAKREETRKRMSLVQETRCPENVGILQEAIKLRLEAAEMLGYKTHAEFVLDQNMAKTPETVLAFENDMRQRLNVLADHELKEIEEMKRADKKAAGEEYTGLYNWDFRYYTNQIKERKHNVSEEEIKQYFPMQEVTRGALDIYQRMLSLRFVKVENPESVWHPDVEMYEVWEASGENFVGHFYLDLYPREGKYNHACVCPIRSSSTTADGSTEFPVAVMLANFPKPTPSVPALLKHDDAVTLFHELGHVFHQICTKSKWAKFSLNDAQIDFVEAPSQMLENWCWEPKILRQFAVHYKTGEPIPDKLVEKMVAAKNEGAGLINLRQVFFSMYDMAIHNTTSADVDVEETYTKLREDITRFLGASQPTWGAATFGHMMSGYDAGYYGYMWSKVFSSDMYASRFLKDGVTNAGTGMDYRREILEPGSSRDAMINLEKFLGRKPTNTAFIKEIGLSA